jgi:hypothetical protein
MNKKEIIIGTTSINRPILHSDNIPGWYEWINSVDKNLYNINWFINIDWIEKLESTVEETKINYKNIIKDIPITFLESETGKGNFLQACKRVSSNIEQYVIDNNFNQSDVIIIWLEDDWKLNPTNIPLGELITKYLSNLTSINLSFIRPNYIHALAPSIINYELWSKLHLEAWKNQTTHIDPEHCVGLHYIKNYGKYIHVNNITVITKKNINEKYLEQEFLNNSKSYYTYNYDDTNSLKTYRYIKESELKEFNKDKMTFIRITNSFCVDGVNYGRNFMKDYDLIKKRVQNDKNIDFYN